MTREPLPASVRAEYLRAMGIDVWQSRDAIAVTDTDMHPESGVAATESAVLSRPDASRQPAVTNQSVDAHEPAAPARPAEPAAANDDWPLLQHEVSRCTRCRLHETRTQPVFGVGDRHARLMIIGEAPGAEEDRSGEPFVGRAGQLLTAMLKGIGLAREQVFIANTLKCRPPQNRDPRVDEISACNDYLLRQIAAIRPGVILAVGRIAAQQLLESDLPLGRMRGASQTFGDTAIPVIVTYHPAYLLRTPAQKALAWEDLKRVKATLEQAA